jgi:hypothetical protein
MDELVCRDFSLLEVTLRAVTLTSWMRFLSSQLEPYGLAFADGTGGCSPTQVQVGANGSTRLNFRIADHSPRIVGSAAHRWPAKSGLPHVRVARILHLMAR